MALDKKALLLHVKTRLAQQADPARACQMAAYMKTDMPFYGVQKPNRISIERELKKDFAPASQAEYEAAIVALWRCKHREEKYLAINYAASFAQYMTPLSVPLYERLIREGQWWDFIDAISGDLLSPILLQHETETRPMIDAFSSDDDFWIRRSALLSHLGHKKETSHKHLFAYCLKMADEKEFFIRKAIGWALREYSKSEPERVRQFLIKNKSRLSPLSAREGGKHLLKSGLIT